MLLLFFTNMQYLLLQWHSLPRSTLNRFVFKQEEREREREIKNTTKQSDKFKINFQTAYHLFNWLTRAKQCQHESISTSFIFILNALCLVQLQSTLWRSGNRLLKLFGISIGRYLVLSTYYVRTIVDIDFGTTYDLVQSIKYYKGSIHYRFWDYLASTSIKELHV